MKELGRFVRGILRSKSQMAERHRPSGVDRGFYTSSRSIDEYVQASRAAVIRARTDLRGGERDWIIEGNRAFERLPVRQQQVRRGVVMVHGLTDAPFLFRDLAEPFADMGFHVVGAQLPGHGTRPGDLLDISWQEWLASLQHLLDLLEPEVDELYLAGFSIGASLCLYQAMRDARVRGLFLFAPALGINPLAPLACVIARAAPRRSRLAWLDVMPDLDFFKYESISNRSVCEVYRLLGALRELSSLADLEVPVFVAASEDDATVDPAAILEWFGALTGPRQMLWYSTGTPELPPGARLIHSALPGQRIRSFAHTSLLQSPANRHYGAQGSYSFCTHYYRLAPDKYRLCMGHQEECLGEMFGETDDCRVIRRLTWNPLFDDLVAQISGFVEQRLEGRPEAVVKP